MINLQVMNKCHNHISAFALANIAIQYTLTNGVPNIKKLNSVKLSALNFLTGLLNFQQLLDKIEQNIKICQWQAF